MLFFLDFVPDHPLYQLHVAVETFFERSVDNGTFGATLFPDSFWDYLKVKDRATLRSLFQSVHGALHQMSRTEREDIYRSFVTANQVEELCHSPTVVRCGLKSLPSTLKKPLDELGHYLYETTLQSSAFQRHVGATLRDHYQDFDKRNPRYLCPFCGLYSYPTCDTRADYDHYLPKNEYVLSTVNFRNLVPMCQTCNEPPNKGQKDIICLDPTVRNVCYYPYSRPAGSDLMDLVVTLGPSRSWVVDFEPANRAFKEHCQIWRRIFNIDTRYREYLKRHEDAWLRQFVAENKRITVETPIDDLRDALRAYRNDRQTDAYLAEVAIFLRIGYFTFLADRTPDAFLRGKVEAALRLQRRN